MFDFLEAISNPIGIIGVILILIGYYLLNTHRMTAKSLSFQLLNFIGAWFILYSLFFHWNLASVLIEAAWILISLVGIYDWFKKRKVAC